jgi:hypothetical protein
VLEVVGAASALALVLSKLTKNKKDDTVVAWFIWLLDQVALNPKRLAEKAGEDALEASPPEGLDGLLGKPKDLD